MIGEQILSIINESLVTGVFPMLWKASKVITIPKVAVAGAVHADEFRPINIIHIFQMILELVVKNQLMNFLNTHDVFNPQQNLDTDRDIQWRI